MVDGGVAGERGQEQAEETKDGNHGAHDSVRDP
jgi:hypothetical protein